jgi:VWFA-related protein
LIAVAEPSATRAGCGETLTLRCVSGYNPIDVLIKFYLLSIVVLGTVTATFAQSGRIIGYSESAARTERVPAATPVPTDGRSDDVIRVETDLVTIPVRIAEKNGRAVPDVKQSEFRIFENGIEQEIAYFQNEEQPFTVALMLDMSYSSVFKLHDIQAAADLFVSLLRERDRVMIVAFDEKVRVLCRPTGDRRALRLAIYGSRIGSGTSIYTAVDDVLREQFAREPGRKAIVVLTDGVDTSSRIATARSVLRELTESEVLVFPIQYDTWDDVQKSRRNDAQILYDEDDRPYVADTPPGRGEREEDYREAREFLTDIAEITGGRLYRVRSNTNLRDAFAAIADELRKIYSLGYYPRGGRLPGASYSIKVRVYRPNLIIRARERSIRGRLPGTE